MTDFESLAWALGAIIVILYMLCHFRHVDFSCFQNIVNCFLVYLNNHSTFIEDITYSYVTALLVYFLTGVISSAKHGQIFLPQQCEQLRQAKDALLELSRCFCEKDWCDSEELIAVAAKNAYKAKPETETTISLNSLDSFIFEKRGLQIKSCVTEVKNRLDSVLMYYDGLSKEELETLLDIRYSMIFEKINDGDYMKQPLEETGLRDFFTELVEANIQLMTIYNKIQKRTFKEK